MRKDGLEVVGVAKFSSQLMTHKLLSRSPGIFWFQNRPEAEGGAADSETDP